MRWRVNASSTSSLRLHWRCSTPSLSLSLSLTTNRYSSTCPNKLKGALHLVQKAKSFHSFALRLELESTFKLRVTSSSSLYVNELSHQWAESVRCHPCCRPRQDSSSAVCCLYPYAEGTTPPPGSRCDVQYQRLHILGKIRKCDSMEPYVCVLNSTEEIHNVNLAARPLTTTKIRGRPKGSQS